MELVYLWVEEYKNIEKQGFNFSPRFECKFENDTLTIIEKDEDKYIDNFFGDNINVTAIVGKNGSGKSSIIEQILESLSSIYRDRLSKKYFICFFDGEKLHCDTNNITNIEVHSNQGIELEEIEEQSQYLLDGLEGIKVLYLDNQTDTTQLNSLAKIDTIPTKYTRHEIDIIASNENHNNIQTILIKNAQEYKDTLLEKEMKKFFIPSKLEITYINIAENFLNLFNAESKKDIVSLEKEFKRTLQKKDYYEAFEKLKSLSDLLTTYTNIKTQDPLNEQDPLNKLNFIMSSSKYQFYNRNDIEYEGKIEYKNQSLIINIENIDERLYNFINSLPQGLFNFNLKNNTKSFNELSYGEKQLLVLFNNILFYSSKIKYHKIDSNTDNYKDINIKNYFIFLDELEIGMHPDWQKKSIAYLLNLLKCIPDKKFHIILTTHSPFLLSDIPKQNIIFLDTYKKDDEEVKNQNQEIGNCKVVDRVSQTFGANIHTLLSDSFFMEDGLMGEFAKGKINKIIRFLNGNNKFIDFPINQIKKVIEVIGEPFLKQKLLDMYDKKFIKEYKDRQKEKIKKQIENLNSQLKELDND